MLLTITLSAAVTALTAAALYFRMLCKTKETDNRRLRQDLAQERAEIQALERQAQDQRSQDAYRQGLHDGRETDTLYRGLLAKYSRGEQATVMMQGEPH